MQSSSLTIALALTFVVFVHALPYPGDVLHPASFPADVLQLRNTHMSLQEPNDGKSSGMNTVRQPKLLTYQSKNFQTVSGGVQMFAQENGGKSDNGAGPRTELTEPNGFFGFHGQHEMSFTQTVLSADPTGQVCIGQIKADDAGFCCVVEFMYNAKDHMVEAHYWDHQKVQLGNFNLGEPINVQFKVDGTQVSLHTNKGSHSRDASDHKNTKMHFKVGMYTQSQGSDGSKGGKSVLSGLSVSHSTYNIDHSSPTASVDHQGFVSSTNKREETATDQVPGRLVAAGKVKVRVQGAVTCKCDTPSAGTAGHNRYHCSDGSSGYCSRNQECYAKAPFPKGQWADGCRSPAPPSPPSPPMPPPSPPSPPSPPPPSPECVTHGFCAMEPKWNCGPSRSCCCSGLVCVPVNPETRLCKNASVTTSKERKVDIARKKAAAMISHLSVETSNMLGHLTVDRVASSYSTNFSSYDSSNWKLENGCEHCDGHTGDECTAMTPNAVQFGQPGANIRTSRGGSCGNPSCTSGHLEWTQSVTFGVFKVRAKWFAGSSSDVNMASGFIGLFGGGDSITFIFHGAGWNDGSGANFRNTFQSEVYKSGQNHNKVNTGTGADFQAENDFELDWRPDSVTWRVNGQSVRTFNDRSKIPQGSMAVRLHSRAGYCSKMTDTAFHAHLLSFSYSPASIATEATIM